MNSKNFDLVCYGEAMLEFQARPDQPFSFETSLGGDTLNVAAYFQKLGGGAFYLSAFGDDEWKDFISSFLSKIDVSWSDQFVSGDQSGLYFIFTDSKGERRFQYYRKGSAASKVKITREISEPILSQSRCFFSSGISQAISEQSRQNVGFLFTESKRLGLVTAFDINFRYRLWSKDQAVEALKEILPFVDFLFCSEEDFGVLAGALNIENDIAVLDEAFARLKASGLKALIFRRGPSSSFVLSEQEWLEIPSLRFEKIVDTTAAGDVFNGGFLKAYLNGESITNSAIFASVAAGLQTQKPGSIRAFPETDQVQTSAKKLSSSFQ